jgi:hypothetical protein
LISFDHDIKQSKIDHDILYDSCYGKHLSIYTHSDRLMRNRWLSFLIPDDMRNFLTELCDKISSELKVNKMNYDDLHMTAIFFLGKLNLTKKR